MGIRPDDRRSRNIVLTALAALFLIYFMKLSFPAHNFRDTIIRHTTAAEEVPIIEDEPPKPTPSVAVSRPPPSHLPSNGTIIDKVAVIIEDRPRRNLIPLILHFHTVLGPSWPIIIYTSSENIGTFSTSAAIGRYLRSGVISIRILPSTVLFTNSDSVSRFLTKPWLYENLAPAEHILLFQSDSMLCSNAARSVEDFLDYDFVGAPIRPQLGAGMNGGLSLRKRRTFLQITNDWDWETHKGSRFEDRWFFDRIHDLLEDQDATDPPQAPAGYDLLKLPTMEIARTFSVETIDYPHPLGVHQVHRWLDKQILSLDEWCPEYKLCSGDYIKDTPS